MSQAIGFASRSIRREGENCALPDEVRGGVVLVELRKNRGKRLPRPQLLGRLRIFCAHIHHKVGVHGEERHLTVRIATIRAVRVGLNELSNCETICRFAGRDRNVFAHELVSLGLKDGPGLNKGLDSVSSVFTADAGVFEPSPGCLWIVGHAVDDDAAGAYL